MKKKKPREEIDEVAETLTTLKLLGINSESFNDILDDLPINLWMHDENHIVTFTNQCVKKNFGDFRNQTCHQYFMGEKNICSCCPSKKTLDKETPDRCKLCKRGNCGYDLNVLHTHITNKDGRKFVLKSSLHIKDLGILAGKHFSGGQSMNGRKKILVMCSSCKRAMDRHNKMVKVDNRIVDYFNVHTTYGLCQECARVLYPTLNRQGRQVPAHTRSKSQHV